VANAPEHLLKSHRGRVLTANDPACVLALLAEAFDAFGAAHPEGIAAPLAS
jgi:hypothetical protein